MSGCSSHRASGLASRPSLSETKHGSLSSCSGRASTRRSPAAGTIKSRRRLDAGAERRDRARQIGRPLKRHLMEKARHVDSDWPLCRWLLKNFRRVKTRTMPRQRRSSRFDASALAIISKSVQTDAQGTDGGGRVHDRRIARRRHDEKKFFHNRNYTKTANRWQSAGQGRADASKRELRR